MNNRAESDHSLSTLSYAYSHSSMQSRLYVILAIYPVVQVRTRHSEAYSESLRSGQLYISAQGQRGQLNDAV